MNNKGSMSSTRARQIQKELNGECPFYTRIEYIECLAALVVLFPDEAVRIAPGPNKAVYKIIWCAAAVDRVEWMFNNIRVRHSMPSSQCQLLASGTAANEALHAEINRWFRQTQQMHQSTLRLKLHILTLSKLVSHNAAMYRPTIRQLPSSIVLARSIGSPIWTNGSWRQWSNRLLGHNHIIKAALPSQEARRKEIVKVKQHIHKRPAAKHTPLAKLKRKRTVFTRQRSGALLRQGVLPGRVK